ncbi:MAG: hypothetical protein Q9219_001473 [cf. Caloplaca sp. 3 TL-2023]
MGSVAATASPIAPSASVTRLPKSAVPNVQHVVLGDLLFKPWYPSYYPEEFIGKDVDRLYICQWCFKYSRDLVPYLAHKKLCSARDKPAPGRLIYSHGHHAIYEVDGEENQLFCQNLSLFAKLFLDNKSVFFDVASFNYYFLVLNRPNGPSSSPSPQSQPQIVGFFSKEKMSWDNNNLACILVFPPWQRRGLGTILMGISYELSRIEGRIGGPEKPLSELGRIGYLKFWEARVANVILTVKNKTTLSVEEIAEACWMVAEDVITTLKEMDVLGTGKKKNGTLMVNKAMVREWVASNRVDLATPVDVKGFAEDYLAEEGDE